MRFFVAVTLLFVVALLWQTPSHAALSCDPNQDVNLTIQVHWLFHRDIPEADNLPWVGSSLSLDEMRSELTSAETTLVGAGINIEMVDDTLVANQIPSEYAEEVFRQVRRIFLGIQPSQSTLNLVAELVAAGRYSDSALNIYFIPDNGIRGLHLRGQDGHSLGVVIYGLGGKYDSLAHEIGHAFSLRHVNFWDSSHPQVEYCAEWGYWDNVCNFERDNIMWAGGEDRGSLHDGQQTRAVCNKNSQVARDIPDAWGKVCDESSIELGSLPGEDACPPVQ